MSILGINMVYYAISGDQRLAFDVCCSASKRGAHVPGYKWYYGLLRFLGISLLAVLPLSGFAKTGKNSSRWVDTAVVIDGNNEEWPKPYPYRDELDAKMQYAIANDAHTLYLTIKTSDETTRMKLRRNGLTIFVDTSGKKLMNLSFGFSVVEPQKAERHRGAQAKTEDAPEDQKLDITGVQVIGTRAYDGTYKLADNKPGIAAAAAVNDYNELVWEIAIPFKCIYTDVGDHVTSRDRISIGFTFFGLTPNDIFELNRATAKEAQNAMPVMKVDSTLLSPEEKSAAHNKSIAGSSDDGEGGNPVRNADGSMGVGIGGGGGKGKGGGKGGGNDAPVIDAVTAMQDRQRAQQDNQVWKEIKLSYEE